MKPEARILIIDDDPVILDLFAELLVSQGYEVWRAETGQGGLGVVKEKHPDLVVSDVMLPDVSGIEVCRQIKASPDLKDVFVILMSGAATTAEDKIEGLTAGADDYLAKPVNIHEFLARVRTALRLQQTTAALRTSEQRYRRLVEIMPDFVGLLDPEGRVLAVNTRAWTELGYTSEAGLMHQSIFGHVVPSDHPRVKADIAATLKEGVLEDHEYTMVRKNGSQFLAEVSASALKHPDGRPEALVVVARDITQRKKSEQSLLRLQTALSQAMEGVALVDLGGNVEYVNPAWAWMHGSTAEDFKGKHLRIFHTEEQMRLQVNPFLERLRRFGFHEGEVGHVRLDGKTFPCWMNASIIKDAKGEPSGIIGMAMDITDRKRLEEVSS